MQKERLLSSAFSLLHFFVLGLNIDSPDGDDNVDVVNDPLEGLEKFLWLSCSSRRARSLLFMKRKGLILLAMACLNTVSVWTQTPETQSTATRAPSLTRRAAVTSLEKSTWPGESIKLMRKPGLLVPSFFLAAGCLMKARSFSSMLKNVEMA